MAKLGDICKFQSGGTPSKTNESFFGGSIPWITTVSLNDSEIDADNAVDWITDEAINKSAAKIVPKDSIMIGTRVGVGKTAINRIEMSTNQDIISLLDIDESTWNKHFLCLFFVSKREYLLTQARGATIKGIKIDTIAELNLPDYSLETQKQIAANLDKVTRTIDLCNAILEKLDLLVKARFVEMFGEKQYPYQELFSLIIEGAGLSYGIVQPGDDGTGDMGVLRPVDLVDGRISTDSIKYIDRKIGAGFQKTELNGDELLITVRGTTGLTALTDKRFSGMNVTRGIAVIRYDAKMVDPIYLNEYLKSDESQRYIQENTRGATLKQINLSDLRIHKILFPPLDLQHEFAAFVAQTDKTKSTVQKVLEKAETLKKALMQEYFG